MGVEFISIRQCLNIYTAEIDCLHLKQLLREFLVHDLIWHVLLGGGGEEAPQDGIDPAFLHQAPRREECCGTVEKGLK